MPRGPVNHRWAESFGLLSVEVAITEFWREQPAELRRCDPGRKAVQRVSVDRSPGLHVLVGAGADGRVRWLRLGRGLLRGVFWPVVAGPLPAGVVEFGMPRPRELPRLPSP